MMHRNNAPISFAIPAALTALALGGCDRSAPPPAEPEPTVEPSPVVTESPISILRETPDPIIEDPVPIEPFDVIVPFADGGSDLSEEAESAIEQAVASRQFELGGKIELRGHTDSVGYDEANLRASQRRAETVAAQLEEAGATTENITIIAMGEMRPIAPNAKRDGTPDEEGRAKNRRVEITVLPPEPDDAAEPEPEDDSETGTSEQP